jgi:RNA polymerase sigma-70 factor (ECF subfamily)
MLKDRAAAEDAAQETFVRGLEGPAGIRRPRGAGTWIYAIARNCCLMELRKRRPTVSFADPDSTEAQHAVATSATGPRATRSGTTCCACSKRCRRTSSRQYAFST